jgi:uroporphyrin-III C-methyltransferase/precorrin-2 dehydrogenase/sirohydrochlorin ferrochelatase
MDAFPLFARLDGQPCLVVGGGTVADRKVRQLLKAGATVTVNAPALNSALTDLAATGRIRHLPDPFDPAMVEDYLLLIAATSDPEINRRVADSARRLMRLCNVVDDGDASSFIMPSVIDRSPILIAVSSSGRSPVVARMLRQKIEAWLPTRIGELAAWAGKWRDAVGKRLSTHAEKLRFWQQLLDGPVAERVLAGDTSKADQEMTRALAGAPTTTRTGEAWIVGAGPGAADLITLRGLQFLQRADIVIHDRLIDAELLALARRDAELIDMGKQPGGPAATQADINRTLVEQVRNGQHVCRLKGGDPFIFGRGGEEIAALAQAGLPYQVVPGITAASGCAAAAGIPLTHRDVARAVTFVTGHDSGTPTTDAGLDWPRLASGNHTLVFYMGVGQLESIQTKLMENGLSAETPIAIVEHGTTPDQRIIAGTLGNIVVRAANAQITSPAIIIVGQVVQQADPSAYQDLQTVDRNPPSQTMSH